MASNALFHEIQNLIIHNGDFRFIIQQLGRTTEDIQGLPQGIQRLINSHHVSWGSLYNSNTRTNQLAVSNAVGGWRPFLEYRTTESETFDQSGVDDAINAIFSWVTDPSTESLIMWVHDDNRMKTSFIAQVVANLLVGRQQLSATFFADEHTDRNSLVPTLVHEFTIHYGECAVLLDAISRVIDASPVGIFNLTPTVQLNRLLITPIKIASETCPRESTQDDIILLHAFEDCNDEGGFQEAFLSTLVDALLSFKDTVFPQRLLIIGKRTDRLEECLMGRLASRSSTLQRPVESQMWIKRYRDICRKNMELNTQEEDLRRTSLKVDDKMEKLREKERQYEEDCERLKLLHSRKEQDIAEKEKLLQENENKLREREESVKQKWIALEEMEVTLILKEEELRIKEEELDKLLNSLRPNPPISPVIRPVIRPIPEPGKQEDARMISPASQATRLDRVVILMGPLVPQKCDFIDCLTRCVNPWRFIPSTNTSNQFFDALNDDLGKGRYWVKAVRTQRQSHSVLFIDFPSLGDDDLASPKILENIGTWLSEIHQNQIAKIAGILYFHPLQEFESRGPSHRNLRALGQMCGDKAAKKVIFVCQEMSPQQKAEFFFQHYYGQMKNLGAGFEYFDNTATSGWNIVDRLLEPQSEDVSLLLQEELLLLRRSLHETYAARQLYGDLILRYTRKLRGSDLTRDQREKIQAELGRLHRLQNRSHNLREPPQFAKPVNFPDLMGFPEID